MNLDLHQTLNLTNISKDLTYFAFAGGAYLELKFCRWQCDVGDNLACSTFNKEMKMKSREEIL